MTETYETAGNSLVETCLKNLSIYKKAVKTVQSQAMRKLVESIIAQKTDQLADLKAIIGTSSDGNAANAVVDNDNSETWSDPELLLATITERENTFAESTRTLAVQAELEEHRSILNACAERSRKFSSWTKDHLDLLSLF